LIDDKETRRVIAGRNLILFNELRKVLCVFQDHDIPVIVLKGAALANSVYDSIGKRPMSDIDLLIHHEDRVRTLSNLEMAGYLIEPKPRKKFHPFNQNLTGEINFSSKNAGIFDLHWELTSAEWVRKIIQLDTEALWCSARPLEINGEITLQLSPVDTLLHVCLHLMESAYSHAVGYQDIVNLISYYRPFPWDEFLAQVIRSRLCTSCYIVLDAVSREFIVDIPKFVLDKIKIPNWKRELIYRLSNPIKGIQGQKISTNTHFLVQLISIDRLGDILSVLYWLFVPGPKWLKERYGLKNMGEGWLACIWHPLVVMRRGLLGVWEVIMRG
jgi:hypothetical protein